MTIFNNKDFITFAGEPITGRVPPRTTVYGPTMNAAQFGGVAHAYKLFGDAYRLSPAGYHVQNRVLADGTKIRMTSNNGVDTVKVYTGTRPPLPRRLPPGIVVSLFKVTEHNEESYTPWWDEEERIPITVAEGEAGSPPAAKYPGAWNYGNYNVLVTIDGKKKLTDTAYEDGQIKFRLVPANAIQNLGVPSVLCNPDDDDGEVWEEGAIPWYAAGAITMGGWVLPVPNVVSVITPGAVTDDAIKLFMAVDIAPKNTAYDQTKVKGWVFFLTRTVSGGQQTFKLFGRRILGMLDPTLGTSVHDSKLGCQLLVEQSMDAAADVAPFGYKVERDGKKIITIKSLGKMFETEVVSDFEITIPENDQTQDATATMTLREVYVPVDPTIPAGSSTIQLKRTVSDLSAFTFEGTPWFNIGGECIETETAYKLAPGTQDGWTGEWTRLPGMQSISASRTMKLVYNAPVANTVVSTGSGTGVSYTTGESPPASITETYGGGLETNVRVTTYTVTGEPEIDTTSDPDIYIWPVSYEWTLTTTTYPFTSTYTHTSTVSSSGPDGAYNYTATDAYTGLAHNPNTYASASFNDTDYRLFATDASPRKLLGMMTKNDKSINIGGGSAGMTTSNVSLVIKNRDPLKPDVVVYESMLDEFVATLQYDSYGSTPAGAISPPHIDYWDPGNPLPNRSATLGATDFTLSSGNLFSPRLPLTEWTGSGWRYRLSYGPSYCDSVPVHPSDGVTPMEYGTAGPAPTAFDVILESSYSTAAYSAAFGVTTTEIDQFGVTGDIVLTDLLTVDADVYNPAYRVDYLYPYTPQIVNDFPKMYADPRNETFITQIAGYGLILGTGMSVIYTEPMLRLLVGNKFGTIALEPQITAWIEDVNKARAAMTPPRPAFPTYAVGDLFIDYDEALPFDESPLF